MLLADLLAGTASRPCPVPAASPRILVFDSGIGGLTVLAELMRLRPDADYVYAADDAAFPYGALAPNTMVARCLRVADRLLSTHRPDLVVVACNTMATLVLPHLRHRFDLPFVGTVPAIKPAAAASRSRRFTVLATPGTVARDYTRGLIEAYAGDCRVDLVGSDVLAGYAEAELAGSPVTDAALSAAIAPCFGDGEGARTDTVVLACTHYPLLRARMERLAPWPVAWIDPAPAIARRAGDLVGRANRAGDGARLAVFTGGTGLTPALREALASRGLPDVVVDPVPSNLS